MTVSDVAETQPRRADARANRESLLTAAAELFTARGTDVSYEEIAERAGVGRATLYRHFPTREALLAGLLDGVMEELENAAAAYAHRPGGLFDLLDFCVRAQQHHVPLVDLVSQTAAPQQMAAMRRRLRRLLAGPLAAAQSAGLVRSDLSVNDVRLLLIMLSALNRRTVTKADRARALALARTVLTGGPAPAG
jgi:AcrR family transcriptional regulator